MSAARRQLLLDLGAVFAIVIGFSLIAMKHAATVGVQQNKIANISYDPTRELYQALNPLFVASYAKETGQQVVVEQSHGGSSRQARKVVSGELVADVVTLGLRSDVDGLRKRGLIADHWEDRLPIIPFLTHQRLYS